MEKKENNNNIYLWVLILLSGILSLKWIQNALVVATFFIIHTAILYRGRSKRDCWNDRLLKYVYQDFEIKFIVTKWGLVLESIFIAVMFTGYVFLSVCIKEIVIIHLHCNDCLFNMILGGLISYILFRIVVIVRKGTSFLVSRFSENILPPITLGFAIIIIHCNVKSIIDLLLLGAVGIVFSILKSFEAIAKISDKQENLCSCRFVKVLVWLCYILAFYSILVMYIMKNGGFCIKEDCSFITAFYYSVSTFTTLGFGDIVPITTEARIITILIVLNGVFFSGSVLSGWYQSKQK